jgi:hypothetical protein
MSTVDAAGSQAALVAQRMLMEQLTSQLADGALPAEGAGNQQIKSLFAQTLADAVAGTTSTTSTSGAQAASAVGAARTGGLA